jgi:hypothetical protein
MTMYLNFYSIQKRAIVLLISDIKTCKGLRSGSYCTGILLLYSIEN